MPTAGTEETGPIYFWMPKGEHGYLSQWHASPFTAPAPSRDVRADAADMADMTFLHTEQYMMYHKAELFRDTAIATEIMDSSSPKAHKALGRMVEGFDNEVWNAHRERIVEEGNWNKFTRSLRLEEGLREMLLATGKRELVEASPRDRIWGVGYGATNAGHNRKKWGLNLLGKALMRVRERLREEEKEKEEEAEKEKE